MKKLSLSLCCLILSGVSVNAVSFQNKSGSPAAVAAHITLNTKAASTIVKFYKDGTKEYKPPIFEKIYWTIGGSKNSIDCPRVDEVGLRSAETFILQKTNSGYECVLQPPLS